MYLTLCLYDETTTLLILVHYTLSQEINLQKKRSPRNKSDTENVESSVKLSCMALTSRWEE